MSPPPPDIETPSSPFSSSSLRGLFELKGERRKKEGDSNATNKCLPPPPPPLACSQLREPASSFFANGENKKNVIPRLFPFPSKEEQYCAVRIHTVYSGERAIISLDSGARGERGNKKGERDGHLVVSLP